MGTWETVGQISGTWLGAAIWMASAPVVVADGPLPFMDAAWMYANARNTNNLRKQGGAIGAGIDDVLAKPPSTTPGTSWGEGYTSPKTSTTENVEFDFSKYGTGFKMGSFMEFGEFAGFIPVVLEIQSVAQEVSDNAMGLKYNYRNSEWPEWDD